MAEQSCQDCLKKDFSTFLSFPRRERQSRIQSSWSPFSNYRDTSFHVCLFYFFSLRFIASPPFSSFLPSSSNEKWEKTGRILVSLTNRHCFSSADKQSNKIASSSPYFPLPPFFPVKVIEKFIFDQAGSSLFIRAPWGESRSRDKGSVSFFLGFLKRKRRNQFIIEAEIASIRCFRGIEFVTRGIYSRSVDRRIVADRIWFLFFSSEKTFKNSCHILLATHRIDVKLESLDRSFSIRANFFFHVFQTNFLFIPDTGEGYIESKHLHRTRMGQK